MRRREILAGGTAAALLAAIAGANGVADMTAAETEAALAGTWAVHAVKDATIPVGLVPLLVFKPTSLGVFGGCNGFSLSLTYLEGGKLMLGPAELNTRTTCTEDAVAVEAQVLRALQRIDGVSFHGDGRITLTAFGTVMLEAARKT